MTDTERARLIAYLVGQGLRAFAFGAALVGLAASVWAIVTYGSAAGAGPWALLPVLCLIWLWLFRTAPLQLWRGVQDFSDPDVETVSGRFETRSSRGPGLFAPHRHWLALAGQRYPAQPSDLDHLAGLSAADVRVAPRTRAVLSVKPVTQSVSSLSVSDQVSRVESLEPLSAREETLLALIAEGLSDKEIARKLNLSPASVRTYNSVLYAKLGVTRRTQAAALVKAVKA